MKKAGKQAVRFIFITTLAAFAGLYAVAQTPVGDSDYELEHLGPLTEDEYSSVTEDTADAGDEPAFSGAELEEIVGPVALYPDEFDIIQPRHSQIIRRKIYPIKRSFKSFKKPY